MSAEPSSARLHLHVALGGIVLLCLSPFVSWAMALLHRDDASGPWRRGLFALAIVDTLVALAFCVVAFGGQPAPRAPSDQPRIGISLNPARPADVEVVDIAPGSPADEAGLKLGDRVLTIDGERIPKNEAVTQVIGRTEPGASRRLRVLRRGSELDVEVTPRSGSSFRSSTSAPRRPLFQAVDRASGAYDLHQVALTGVAELAAVGIVCFVAYRRRAVSLLGGIGVLPALATSTLAMLATLEAFRRTVGLSLGASLVSMVMGGVALLVAGLALRRRAGLPSTPTPASASTAGTVGLGVFYGLAGSFRVAALLVALWPSDLAASESARSVGPQAAWGPAGIALGVVAMAVVIPMAEELLFRGVLLPWIQTWSTPLTAVMLSAFVFAVGHLHYRSGAAIIFVYGLVLGWARLRTGNLRASIALHMLLNATVCAATLLRG